MIVHEVDTKKTEGAEKDSEAERRAKSRERKRCSGEARIEIRDTNGQLKILTGKLVDISDFGVGIETDSPLRVGQLVIISSQFFATEANAERRRQAHVIHCRLQGEKRYRSGFAFDGPENQKPGGDRKLPKIDGSFVDYYEVLQVSPHADLEMIQRVFRILAQRYHPDNVESGNDQVFRLILQAYRVLSDPEQRASYDAKHRAAHSIRWKIFERPEDTEGFEAEKRIRNGILAALYAMRKKQPERPGMNLREIEELLGCPREHLEFSMWYLKGKSLVQSTDNGRFEITPEGVDAMEQAGPAAVQPIRPLLEAPHSS